MNREQVLLERLDKLLSQKRSKKYYAEKLGVSEKEVESLMSQIRNMPKELDYSFSKKVNDEKGTVESVVTTDFDPKTPEELAALHKIDLEIYTITNYWSKLLPSGKFTSSVFCKKKTPSDYSPEDFLKLLEKYKPRNIEIIKSENNKEKEHVDVEISISDFHLAKRHINGEDNDIETRAKRYINVAESLIKKIRLNYNIDKVVLPISNDFFHTDNYQNQTTNGTPQDIIVEYSKEYEMGFDILVSTINLLRQHCNEVIVVLVQGNHDRTKSFYLAHALEVFFKNSLDVTFLREHSVVKGLSLGNTFIGWHHGNCKIEELPLLFATHPSYSDAFGKAKYREVHTGDKHHYMAKEVKGVRIQQMPSLSGTDRWHADNNYVHSVRAALALVYDKQTGKTAEFEKRI
jgi:hypothetical protein